jgi:hypothetical protein
MKQNIESSKEAINHSTHLQPNPSNIFQEKIYLKEM